ncbi:DUF4347 domain-containing protein [Geitlerinema sp. CS-897]|nr:DUF4347 domain-containing protein [Geitlerinema sp. CS-897]
MFDPTVAFSDASDRTLVIIDGAIADRQTLLSGLDPRIETVVLDTTTDGLQQISEVLADRNDLDAVHLITHGDAGRLQLGNASLDGHHLDDFADILTDWGNALDADGDFLLYGCNVAAGTRGREFIETFATLTNADVAASDDLTGYGGDWALEVRWGDLETAVAIDRVTRENYRHNFATIPVPAGDKTALIDAIALANSTPENDTIVLEGGTYTITTSNNGTGGNGDNALPSIVNVAVGGTLTIEGNDATIERSSIEDFRLFHVINDGNLTLADLTLRGGSSTIDGGGALFNRGTVTLANVTITENESIDDGGAIENVAGATLFVEDSRFFANVAASDGGAIFNRGTANVSNSVIEDNEAEFGGGIYDFGATLRLFNSQISDNQASEDGGGIASESGSAIAIFNSAIDGNEAGFGGGGIAIDSGLLQLLNSTVSNNRGFGGETGGGGLNAFDSTVEITNSTISGNQMPSSPTFGGGIANIIGTLSIRNSTIVENEATDFGGGIGLDGGSLAIANSIVANNRNATDEDDIASFSTLPPGISLGFNLVGVDPEGVFNATGDRAGTAIAPLDPLLSPLQDNGGPTLTHLPLDDSLAIDGGNIALAIDPTTSQPLLRDQRGFPRLAGSAMDIGAVEVQTGDAIALVESAGNTRFRSGYGFDTYEIQLLLSPSEDVTVTLSADTLTFDASQLTFTPANWNVPQLVTVTAPLETAAGTFAITHTVTSEDLVFDGLFLEDVSVTVTNPMSFPGEDVAIDEASILGFSEGDDAIAGSNGRDDLYLRGGNDAAFGNGDVDRLYGGNDDDYLNGGEATDYLNGGLGDDDLDGESGIDVLFGGEGSDRLRGGADIDWLFGGLGDDELIGGSGSDILSGGDGNDIFVLERNGAPDTINDFQVLQDKLSLTNGLRFEDLEFVRQVGSNSQLETLVRDGVTGEAIAILVGINPSFLSEIDFI